MGLVNKVTYGVALDDPASTPAAECRYDACVEVSAEYPVREPARAAELAGGSYAVAQFHGTAADRRPGALSSPSCRPTASRRLAPASNAMRPITRWIPLAARSVRVCIPL
jgi:hypothetical protein